MPRRIAQTAVVTLLSTTLVPHRISHSAARWSPSCCGFLSSEFRIRDAYRRRSASDMLFLAAEIGRLRRTNTSVDGQFSRSCSPASGIAAVAG